MVFLSCYNTHTHIKRTKYLQQGKEYSEMFFFFYMQYLSGIEYNQHKKRDAE